MVSDEEVVRVISFWRGAVSGKKLLPRELVNELDASGPEVVDVAGVRRCGKSSMLLLLMRRVASSDNFLYINFEDPFFVENNSPSVILDIVRVYIAYFSKSLKYLFLDEVQEVKGWERAVRTLRDSGDYKIFVTGSSSILLSGELATLLTGRHLSFTAFPLSFKEYLGFRKVAVKEQRGVILNCEELLQAFSGYISGGGFPEVVLTGSSVLLRQYFRDIVSKDIAGRYEVRQADVLEKICIFLVTNSGRPLSLAAVAKSFGVSSAFASRCVSYCKEAFLVFELPRFSYSLKTQAKAPKKVYCVDNGLAGAVSFRFSEERGRMLEQAVFLHLKRLNGETYYFKTASNEEVDFLFRAPRGKAELIQVSWSVKDNETRKREIRALVKAMGELSLDNALLLTFDEAEEISAEGKKITVMPAYKWMLERRQAHPKHRISNPT